MDLTAILWWTQQKSVFYPPHVWQGPRRLFTSVQAEKELAGPIKTPEDWGEGEGGDPFDIPPRISVQKAFVS